MTRRALVLGTTTRSRSPRSYDATAASGSPPIPITILVSVGFLPVQFGLGTITIWALWSQLSIMNGPDAIMSAASAYFLFFSLVGVVSHIAMRLLKKLTGVASLMTRVFSSGAVAPSFSRSPSIVASSNVQAFGSAAQAAGSLYGVGAPAQPKSS